MQIRADFDSGNIQVIDASDPRRIRLAIRPDLASQHFQWFHFCGRGHGCRHRAPLHPGQRRPVGLQPCLERLPGSRLVRWRTLVPRTVAIRRRRPAFPAGTGGKRSPLRLLRALQPRTACPPGRTCARHRGRRTARRRHQRARPRHRIAAGQAPSRQPPEAVGHRPAASRRTHGRMVHGRPDRAPAAAGRYGNAAPAGKGRPVPGAEHEPGRRVPRQPAHQRRRPGSQPGLAGAERRAQPGSLVRPAGDEAPWRRPVPRHPRRRGNPHVFAAGCEGNQAIRPAWNGSSNASARN